MLQNGIMLAFKYLVQKFYAEKNYSGKKRGNTNEAEK